jgi:hypothetical protein
LRYLAFGSKAMNAYSTGLFALHGHLPFLPASFALDHTQPKLFMALRLLIAPSAPSGAF